MCTPGYDDDNDDDSMMTIMMMMMMMLVVMTESVAPMKPGIGSRQLLLESHEVHTWIG